MTVSDRRVDEFRPQHLQVFFFLSEGTARLALETLWDLLPLVLYLLCLTLILCRFERVCFLGRQSPDCMGVRSKRVNR